MSEEGAKSAGSTESAWLENIRKEFQQSLEIFYSELKPLSISTAKKESVTKLLRDLIATCVLEERVERDENKAAEVQYSTEEEIAYTYPIPIKYLREPFRDELGTRAVDLHGILEPLIKAKGFEFCPDGSPCFYLLLASETDGSVLHVITEEWKAVDCTPFEIKDAIRTISALGFKISINHLEGAESIIYVIAACLLLVTKGGSCAYLYTVFSVMKRKSSKQEYTIPPHAGT